MNPEVNLQITQCPQQIIKQPSETLINDSNKITLDTLRHQKTTTLMQFHSRQIKKTLDGSLQKLQVQAVKGKLFDMFSKTNSKNKKPKQENKKHQSVKPSHHINWKSNRKIQKNNELNISEMRDKALNQRFPSRKIATLDVNQIFCEKLQQSSAQFETMNKLQNRGSRGNSMHGFKLKNPVNIIFNTKNMNKMNFSKAQNNFAFSTNRRPKSHISLSHQQKIFGKQKLPPHINFSYLQNLFSKNQEPQNFQINNFFEIIKQKKPITNREAQFRNKTLKNLLNQTITQKSVTQNEQKTHTYNRKTSQRKRHLRDRQISKTTCDIYQ